MAIVTFTPEAEGQEQQVHLQAAIDALSDGDELIIPNAGYDLIIAAPEEFTDSNQETDLAAIQGKSNITLRIRGQLVAKAGSFLGIYQCMMDFRSKTNFHIIFETGSYIKMQKAEYLANEHRHCLKIIGSSNFTITGVNEDHLKDSGGDGLIIQTVVTAVAANRTPCSNYTVTNMRFKNNRRQGISILSAAPGTLTNCYCSDTLGTAPQSGIDIEPEHPVDVINLTINNPTCENNAAQQFTFNFSELDSTSPAPQITINNANFTGGVNSWGINLNTTVFGPAGGHITFNDAVISGTGYAAVRGNWLMSIGMKIVFNRLRILNCSTVNDADDAVLDFNGCSGPSTGGGIEFNDAYLLDSTFNRQIVRSSSLHTGIRGTVTVDRANQTIQQQNIANLPNLNFILKQPNTTMRAVLRERWVKKNDRRIR